jgi:hypothetical protein
MNVTRRGFTLIEATISGAVLLVTIGLALSLFADANRTVGESLQLTEVAVTANRLERLLRQELRGSAEMRLGATEGGVFTLGATSTSPAGEFTSLQYRPVTGFDTSLPGVTLGAIRELRFVYDAGESGGAGTGSGEDDDGDGRVDEGTLQLFVDDNGDGLLGPSERKKILAHHVSSDDMAFSFASGAETDQNDDLSLRVQFTVVLRTKATGTADGTNGETRQLVIPLRNKS